MNYIGDALLTGCIRREGKAQQQLYDNCYPFLMRICIRYVNNQSDAEELFSMGFLKILSNIEKYKKEIPFVFWIRRIMINTIITEHHKNKKRKEIIEHVDFTDHYEEYDPAVIHDYVQKMDAEQIYYLIMQLPPVSRQVFNLFAIDGFTHKEIAAMLNMSEGTSKWHVNFARNKLKEMLSDASETFKIKFKVS